MSVESKYSFQRFLWIALGVTAFRIFYLFINHRDLDIEEAQYWTWSRHLALGYHSKPPMISWIIHFSTWLFGNSEWAIRIFSPITYLFSAMLLYGCGKILYHHAIGFWSGISVLLLPGVTYSATIISTDPLLLLFWCLALYAFIQACWRRGGRLQWWSLCGIAIGLGLLSKYTMAVFFLCAGLYFICSLENPHLLKKAGPYIAILLAFLTFLPNAIWNTQHHNAALHHVIEHNIDVHGVHWQFKNLGFFLLTQIGILGPIIFLFLLIALLRLRHMARTEAARLLICFTLPMLILIMGEALLSRAYGNWAVVAYPSGTILAVVYLWENHLRRWLKVSVWLNVVIAIVLCGWELAVAYGYCQWPKPNRPNWQDFGNEIQNLHTLSPRTPFLVTDRELWSKTQYYGKVSREDLYVWDPQKKADWVDNPVHFTVPPNQDFFLVTYHANISTQSFKQYKLLGDGFASQRLLGRQSHIYFYWVTT